MMSSLFSFGRRPSWLRLASLPPAESHCRDESPIVGRITAACTLPNHHRGHPLPGSTVPVIRRADSDEVHPVNLVYSRGSPSSSLCALPRKHSKTLSSLPSQATPHQVTNLFFSSGEGERGLEDMAPSKARAFEFDVFLSFSGADTRFDFTDFLSRDLNNAGIRVFRDEDAIEVGDKIGQTILQAIDNSKIYVPIISQTYPDSEWCLIELEHMMYNVFRSNAKKKIFPIFYKVEPAHVKHRTPRPKNLSSEEALAKVGQIKGWKVEEGQSQAKIVDSVVRKVLEELGRKDESQTEHLIELDDLTQSLEDSYNHAVMRYAGRESLSRGSIGRGTSLSSTSTERRWSNLSINRMKGMDMEEARVSTGRSGSKGSLSINRMEDMYMEEGSGSTGGEVEAAEVEGAVEAAEGLAVAEEGGAGAVEAAGNSSGEEEAGEAVRGSFQDICLGKFLVCLLYVLCFSLSLLKNKETSR